LVSDYLAVMTTRRRLPNSKTSRPNQADTGLGCEGRSVDKDIRWPDAVLVRGKLFAAGGGGVFAFGRRQCKSIWNVEQAQLSGGVRCGMICSGGSEKVKCWRTTPRGWQTGVEGQVTSECAGPAAHRRWPLWGRTIDGRSSAGSKMVAHWFRPCTPCSRCAAGSVVITRRGDRRLRHGSCGRDCRPKATQSGKSGRWGPKGPLELRAHGRYRFRSRSSTPCLCRHLPRPCRVGALSRQNRVGT